MEAAQPVGLSEPSAVRGAKKSIPGSAGMDKTINQDKPSAQTNSLVGSKRRVRADFAAEEPQCSHAQPRQRNRSRLRDNRRLNIVDRQGVGVGWATPLPGIELEGQLPGRAGWDGSRDGTQVYAESLPGIGCSQLVVERRVYGLRAAKIIAHPRLQTKLDVARLAAVSIERKHVVRRVRVRVPGNRHQLQLPGVIVTPGCCRHGLLPGAVRVSAAQYHSVAGIGRGAPHIRGGAERACIPAVKVLVEYLCWDSGYEATEHDRHCCQLILGFHKSNRIVKG